MTSTDHTSVDDATLLRQFTAGDESALEALLVRHTRLAYSISYAILRNSDDAWDATQTALQRFAASVEESAAESCLKTRVCMCAQTAARDLLRSNVRRQRREKVYAEQRAGEPHMPTGAPTDSAETGELVAALREELAALPETTAAVLALHHLDGQPVAAVAVDIGLSLDACKQRLSRGRETLRERLAVRGFALALTPLAALLTDVFESARQQSDALPPDRIAALARSTVSGRRSGEAGPSALPPITARPNTAVFRAVALLIVAAVAAATYFVATPSARSTVPAAPPLQAHPEDHAAAQTAASNTSATTGTAAPALAAVDAETSTKSKPKTSDAAETAKPDAPPVAAATSRWRPLRVVPAGFGMHFMYAIAVSGQHAAVMSDGRDPKATWSGVDIVESNDDGQNWKSALSLPKYCRGAMAYDADGNLCVLGQAIELVKKPGSEVVTGQIASLDYFTCPRGQNPTAPALVFKGAVNQYLNNTALLCAKDGVWSFGLLHEMGMFGGSALVVARGKGVAPTPVKTDPNAQGSTVGPVSCWAVDANSAGCVLALKGNKDPNADGLSHITTDDGGTTWKITPIPFHFGSDETVRNPIPAGLARDGTKLALLVVASPVSVARDDAYVLLSDDLGKTWSDPCLVGRKGADTTTFSSSYKYAISFTNQQLWVVQSAPPPASLPTDKKQGGAFAGVGMFPDVYQWRLGGNPVTQVIEADLSNGFSGPQVEVRVCFSSDRGNTWFQQDALIDSDVIVPDLVAGGDAHSLHLALDVLKRHGNTITNEASLLFKTFSPENFVQRAEPLPDWLKDQPEPDPVQLKF